MQKQTVTKGFDWLRFSISLLGVLLLGMLIVGISLIGLNRHTNRQINLGVKEKSKKTSILKTASYQLSYHQATTSGELSFDVRIDPDQNKLDGADLLLSYDTENIKIKRISLGTAFTHYHFKDNDGFIKISAWNNDPALLLKTKEKLVTIYYEKINPFDDNGKVVSVVCKSGSSTESNLSQQGADVLNCGAVKTYSNAKTNTDGIAGIFLLDPIPTQASEIKTDNLISSTRYMEQYFTDGCNKISPPRPTDLKAISGPKYGEVTLSWEQKSYATHYAVTYGTKWIDFENGDIDMGNTNNHIVKGLKVNVPYYFVITAVDHCASSGYSDGASAYAGGSGTQISKKTTTLKKGGQVKIVKSKDYDWAYQNVNKSKGGSQFASPSATPIATIAPTTEPEIVLPSESQQTRILNLAFKYLPWIGLGLLILLTILLIMYASSKKKNLSELQTLVEDKNVPNNMPSQSVEFPNDFRNKR